MLVRTWPRHHRCAATSQPLQQWDEARGDGITGEAGGLMDVEFVHDMLPVLFDRLDADAERQGDLLVARTRQSRRRLRGLIIHLCYDRARIAPCRFDGAPWDLSYGQAGNPLGAVAPPGNTKRAYCPGPTVRLVHEATGATGALVRPTGTQNEAPMISSATLKAKAHSV